MGGVRMKKTLFGFRPGDGAVIAAVIAVAVLLLFATHTEEHGASVTVLSDGGQYSWQLSDTGERRITSAGYTLTVVTENGAVRVLESDCPGGDCVTCGEISRVGQCIVCLPARTVIRITGEAADADFILP